MFFFILDHYSKVKIYLGKLKRFEVILSTKKKLVIAKRKRSGHLVPPPMAYRVKRMGTAHKNHAYRHSLIQKKENSFEEMP